MQFTFAVKKLDDRLNRTFSSLESCKELYEKEGINEPEMLESFDKIGKDLSVLKKSIAEILAANERQFDMIEFLTEALKLEYQITAELQSYIRVIPDQGLCKELNKLLLEETKHEEVLASQIRNLGGDPQVHYKIEPKPAEMSIIDLLSRHRQMDMKTKKHYDVGLSRFKEPEFQWILSKLTVEEAEHLKKIDVLIGKYQEEEVLSDELKNIKWVDPYMGTPGDRSWVE